MEQIRKKVTMVFQNGALFDSLRWAKTLHSRLRDSARYREEQIHQIVNGLLDMVGVKEMRDMLPSDLSTGNEAIGCDYAGAGCATGMRSYDEPTTMVDPLMAQLLGDSSSA